MNLSHIISIFRFLFGGTKPSSGPLKVHWDIEYKCNSRCKTCQRWNGPYPNDQLTTVEGLDLIDELADLGVMTLSFSGNEPLLRDDIYQLIAYAHIRKIRTSLNTNGLLLNEKNIDKLIRSHLDMIYFSIDGHTPELHDRIRGVPGGFQKILDAKELFGKKKGAPILMVNTVANHLNIPYLDKIVEFIKNENFDGILIQPAHNIKTFFEQIDETTVIPDDVPILTEKLKFILKSYGNFIPLQKKYFKEFETFYTNPGKLYRYRCSAGYITLDIRQNGEITPCPLGFASGGYYKKGNLRKLWYSNKMNSIRMKIKNNDHPICWFACIVPINLIFSSIRRFEIFEFFNYGFMRHIFRKLK